MTGRLWASRHGQPVVGRDVGRESKSEQSSTLWKGELAREEDLEADSYHPGAYVWSTTGYAKAIVYTKEGVTQSTWGEESRPGKPRRR